MANDEKPRKRIKTCHPTPIYFTSDNLRKVQPYDFTFQSFAKGRWIDKTIYDVFITEFRDRSFAYYAHAIECGRIQVNSNTVSKDYILKNGDLVTHITHRHEPPVLNSKIEIVFQSDDMLVVSKPPSIPVHPTGRYTHNTLINILQYEYGYTSLFPINRIDRLTSGIVLLGLNKKTAQLKTQEMMNRKIQKTYLCRVMGEFPDKEITCDKPLAIFAHKLGINRVCEKTGKEATTIFKKRSFNGKTSVVECRPLTGRTHQIRVHLQYLGFPIANDPLYASQTWGIDGGKGGVEDAKLAQITSKLSQELATDPKNDEEAESDVVLCYDCEKPRDDPKSNDLLLWLHSIKYQGDGWSYETAEPDWARDDYDLS